MWMEQSGSLLFRNFSTSLSVGVAVSVTKLYYIYKVSGAEISCVPIVKGGHLKKKINIFWLTHKLKALS